MPHLSDRKRRLFVAALLPPEIGAALDERLDRLRSALSGLRWVHSASWHITVEFIGGCGPHETERQIVRWADRSHRTFPFEVAVAGAGTFPDSWRARVFWAGLDVDETGWRHLAGQDRTPHVTVARSSEPRDLTKAVHSLSTYRGLPWRVEEIALMEARLGPTRHRGSRYEPLEVFPLSGSSPSAPEVGGRVSHLGRGQGLDAV